jgi:hypothetical protein
MKKTLLLTGSFVLFLSVSLRASDTLKVLFLGNSYTYVNDLPGLCSGMAQSTGDVLIYNSNCLGGYTLKQHFSNSQTLSLIQQGGWDFVILQEQSQWPSFPMNMVEAEVFPYARGLDSLIRKFNGCAETVFYRTWGRKNGDQSNCAAWPPVCTYRGMDSLLNERYRIMADSNNAILSPVGSAWKFVRENFPDIELYSFDESHPSEAGSYLAACCFYTVLFRKDPTLIGYNYTLADSIAAKLRYAVKQVVFDNLLFWNVGKYDPSASFQYTISLSQATFTNTSLNASYYRWHFGDGSTSSAPAPSHQYPGPGNYTVRLVAGHCNREDSTENILNITVTEVRDQESAGFAIYPLPAGEYVKIRVPESEKGKEYAIKLIDSVGREILAQPYSSSEEEVHLGHIPRGLYLLEITSDGKSQKRWKVLVQ